MAPGTCEVCTLERGTKTRLRVVFMGSDAFSVPSLEACAAVADVVAVYVGADRRSGRGRSMAAPSPVKELAVSRGLRVEQPEKFDKECCERLAAFCADLIVVAAYGHILPRAALGAARLDSVNVHASLLPRHRGAAPVAAAILAGDADAGVTIMKLRPRLDAGELICTGTGARRAQRATVIGRDETAGELSERLARIGGELVGEVLAAFADGSVTYEAQDEAQATFAPPLQKSDGRIVWARPAEFLARHVRAMTPWPGAFSEFQAPGRGPVHVIVLEGRASEDAAPGAPGRVEVRPGPRMFVATGAGRFELLRLKPAGRAAMAAAEFVRGCAALREPGRHGECSFAGG